MNNPNYTYDQHLEDSGANLDEYLKELALIGLEKYLFAFIESDDLLKYTHEDEDGLHLDVDALRDDIYFNHYQVIRIDRYMSAWHKANELYKFFNRMFNNESGAVGYKFAISQAFRYERIIDALDERITKEMHQI